VKRDGHGAQTPASRIRWATYPDGIGVGAGLILGLVLAIVAGVSAFRTDAVREALDHLRQQSNRPGGGTPGA
jgi:ABC-type nitrate/sulfonate/bicarbonate transport system permease component